MTQAELSPIAKEERDIYSVICSHKGIKAKEIAALTLCERKTVNHWLYASPLLKELCYQDRDSCWHGLITQDFPHRGLEEFSGFYSRVGEFLECGEEEWLQKLLEGCDRIGRNTNNTRGLLHSFRDEYAVMRSLFESLSDFGVEGFEDWELVFELRIKKSRYIRIYADVLLISPGYVFTLEFKMKDKLNPEELEQAFKYCRYQDVIFGSGCEIVPVLVLTGAKELFESENSTLADGAVHVCSGDMLFNVIDNYYNFLN